MGGGGGTDRGSDIKWNSPIVNLCYCTKNYVVYINKIHCNLKSSTYTFSFLRIFQPPLTGCWEVLPIFHHLILKTPRTSLKNS